MILEIIGEVIIKFFEDYFKNKSKKDWIILGLILIVILLILILR